MTTRFAGSRCLDERRRRRLAGEAEEHEPAAAPAATAAVHHEAKTVIENSTDEGTAAAPASHFPIRRLISRRLWKLWAVGLLVLLAGANIVLAGSLTAARTEKLGPGFAHLFDLSAGRLLKPLAILLLLVSSQLACLIWWVRSRSPRDFAGRYRLWSWCAVLGTAGTLIVAADLHIAWSKTALWLWDIDFPHGLNFRQREQLVWLAPLALAALGALRGLHREMRDCRVNLTLLWMAAVCGLGACLLQLELAPLPLSMEESRLVHWGAQLSACWLLFMSLLLHARHVVHVTADAPRVRRPWFPWSSLWRWPWSLLSRTVKRAGLRRTTKKSKPTAGKKPVPEKKSAAAGRKSKDKPAAASAKQKADQQKPAAKAAPKKKAAQSSPAENKKATAGEPQTSKSAAAQESDTLPMSARGDAAPSTDADSLQGLSKRERRRLRKQQREAQRDGKSQRRAA